jgi:hypothetical protein
VLGKAARRHPASAVADGASASASAPPGSDAPSAVAAAVWLLPRLVRAINFQRLTAHVRRALGSLARMHSFVIALFYFFDLPVVCNR